MGRLKQEWITALASPDSETRLSAAQEICAAGRARAQHSIRLWHQNADFARLIGKEPERNVGLAVRPETFAQIREANDWPRLADVPPEQDASEFTLSFANGLTLDVLTSRDEEGSGAIAKFLRKFGEDIQQVEIRCSDVDRATSILSQQFNVAAVYPEARPGADGTKVNFFLVSGADAEKVLIELYEPAAILFE
jgi:hypothetical protein